MVATTSSTWTKLSPPCWNRSSSGMRFTVRRATSRWQKPPARRCRSHGAPSDSRAGTTTGSRYTTGGIRHVAFAVHSNAAFIAPYAVHGFGGVPSSRTGGGYPSALPNTAWLDGKCSSAAFVFAAARTAYMAG